METSVHHWDSDKCPAVKYVVIHCCTRLSVDRMLLLLIMLFLLLVFNNSVHHWDSDKCPAVKYVDAVVAGYVISVADA